MSCRSGLLQGIMPAIMAIGKMVLDFEYGKTLLFIRDFINYINMEMYTKAFLLCLPWLFFKTGMISFLIIKVSRLCS